MSQSTTQSQSQSDASTFRESALYHEWYRRVASGDPNDFLVVISAHPGFTGTSGVGKSTLGARVAREFHINGMAGDWSTEKHYTLDIEQFAYETLPEADQGAAIFGDEMQGTVANTNLNRMRAQKTEQLRALAAIAGDRKNRKTKVLVFQTLTRVNPYLFDYVDSWLLIVDDSNYVANHYKVLPKGVFDLSSTTELKTPRVERIKWDSLAADDEQYARMEALKDRANQGKGEFIDDDDDVDEQIPKSVRDEKIKELYQKGITQGKLAEAFGLTQPTVSDIINDKA